jgi:hypothetical protein
MKNLIETCTCKLLILLAFLPTTICGTQDEAQRDCDFFEAFEKKALSAFHQYWTLVRPRHPSLFIIGFFSSIFWVYFLKIIHLNFIHLYVNLGLVSVCLGWVLIPS